MKDLQRLRNGDVLYDEDVSAPEIRNGCVHSGVTVTRAGYGGNGCVH
jgi:hypothetical protein